MKKTIACLTALVMLTALTAACSGQSAPADREAKLQIVATFFPQYDWMRHILGDAAADAELTLLAGSGVDLHSFQPGTEDIVKISTCDMLIYTGGESDAWVQNALKTATNGDMVVVNLLDVLGDAVKEQEIVEGMEHDHEHEQDDDHAHDHGEAELDEHVWLSLRHAQTLCAHLADMLGQLNPAHAEVYAANAAAYNGRLAALDAEYLSAVASAARSTLLFADRFPFRYLTDDYGLEYYAAFSGCSAETEADFETIVFLANKADELSLESIMVIETSDRSIAKTVIASTKAKDLQILVLDSLQSVTSARIASGEDYYSIMSGNLEVLKKALN